MNVKELEESLKEELSDKKSIILYNDDINTFGHVIACLVLYCDHTPIQAEQCANIVHNNGKCSVKTGDLLDLIPIKSQLLMHKLNAEIE